MELNQASSCKVKQRISLVVLSLILIIIDQLTKMIARQHLIEYLPKHFLPSWNWTLMYNEGAAFSFLANQGGWQKLMFGFFALVVSIWILYYLICKSYTLIAGIAFSCILSGALGNLIDRIIVGKVTDFIDWYIGAHHWPAFNIADSCISIGVTLLIIESLFFTNNNSATK
ncbi:MAG: hypothetical protein RLZZ293_697 [Pseudomonadota bacterium]|jgi:signal peptidase II